MAELHAENNSALPKESLISPGVNMNALVWLILLGLPTLLLFLILEKQQGIYESIRMNAPIVQERMQEHE